MGLDQSFYDKKPKVDENGYLLLSDEDVNEIAYYRKHHNLHRLIGEVLGEEIGNGAVVRLGSSDISAIVDFILRDESFWGYPQDGDLSDVYTYFFRNIGALMFYAANNKPIYYSADW